MNDRELIEKLRAAPVPERSADYWERFPKRVAAEMHRRELRRRGIAAPRLSAPRGSWALRIMRMPALGLGLGTLCVVLGYGVIVLGRRDARPANGQLQFAQVQKCYREVEALFPNQLQGLVFDQRGPHLMLADTANVPVSPPLYVKVCGPAGCQSFVTFSGQRIRVNGEPCDVLVDHQGDVLLVGRQLVWSSGDPADKSGPCRIEAKSMGGAS